MIITLKYLLSWFLISRVIGAANVSKILKMKKIYKKKYYLNH